MRRWSLAVVVLVLSTISAEAREPCGREPRIEILPAPGARDVPRNTRLWVLGAQPGTWEVTGGDLTWVGAGTVLTRDPQSRVTAQRFELAGLAADRSYAARGVDFGPSTHFATGALEDHTAPAAPFVRALAIAVRDHRGGDPAIPELSLDVALDPDAAMLRFTFETGGRSVSAIATPGTLRKLERPAPSQHRCGVGRGPAMCDAMLALAAGDRVRVSITAIDLAGNESPATTHVVEVAVLGLHDADDLEPLHGHGPLRALGMGASVLAVLALLLIRHFRRTTAVAGATPRAISLLAAERLARGVQRHHGVIAAIGVVGVPTLVATGLGPLAVISTIVGCIGLRGFFIARAVLQLIERGPGGASAEAFAHVVVVHTDDEEVRLEVAPRALAAALRHAVPTSIAQR